MEKFYLFLKFCLGVDVGGYSEQQVRRRAFGSWLRQVVAESVEKSLEATSTVKVKKSFSQ